MTDRPLVSAALIIRNEERFLAGCLDSLAGVADEVVLVDTGSTDGTISIARDRGLVVHSFPWVDDFSAARNRAIELARGEWILYIDADEQLRSGAAAHREKLLSPRYIAHQVLLAPTPGSTPYWILRLFRNRPSIRFRGIIHENIWPALVEYQESHGGAIGHLPLELDHFGYQDNQPAKHDRNLPLLKRSLELDPTRVYCWCHLAAIQRDLGDPDSAIQSWRRATEIVRGRTRSLVDDSYPWNDWITFELSRDGDITELADEAIERFPDHLPFYWLKGRFLMGRKRFEEAIPYFDKLTHAGETGEFSRHASYDKRMLGIWAYESRATCNFRLENWSEAERDYGLAFACDVTRFDLRAKRALAQSKAAALGQIASETGDAE